MADSNDELSAATTPLIRTGRDGRQRFSEDYKRQVLDTFETSGMSGKAFAEQCGVKYPTFASWLAKRRRSGGSALSKPTAAAAPAFLLAEIGETSDSLELTLPGGITARIATPAQARLLAALLSELR